MKTEVIASQARAMLETEAALPVVGRRLWFIDQSIRAINKGELSGSHIARVAERQSILRGDTAKSVHRLPVDERGRRYAEAALAIIIAQ
jgi:hypothetical protein